MTNVVSIDQSLGKCAWTLWEGGKARESGILKSGNSKVKGKIKGVTYFDTLEDQTHYLASELVKIFLVNNCSIAVFEALSFGSAGNATRDLAQLFGALIERLMTSGGIVTEDIHKVAPTALKAFARNFLPEADQYDGFTKAGKPKLVKMDKKLMVRAASAAGGDPFLKGLKMSGKDAGLDDAADSFLLGLYYFEKLNGNSKNL